MSRQHDFRVRIIADDNVNSKEYLIEVLGQLEGMDGVDSVLIADENERERDIGEVEEILDDLSTEELAYLAEAIESYTDD